MNNIKFGRFIANISYVVVIFALFTSRLITEVYSTILLCLGAGCFTTCHLIAYCICKCPDCGHPLMTRHGNIGRRCQKCGRVI